MPPNKSLEPLAVGASSGSRRESAVAQLPTFDVTMRVAKTITLIVVFTLLAGFDYSQLPTSWCGTCPKRSFSIPGTGGYVRIVEWWPHSRETTWLCIGDSEINIPLTPTFVIVSFADIAAALAGLAPAERHRWRLAGLVGLGTVFTAFSTYFASALGEDLGTPLPPGAFRLPWECAMVYALLSLTVVATVGLWLACIPFSRRALAHGGAEPGATPNGGPATQLGNSGAAEGPPSVN